VESLEEHLEIFGSRYDLILVCRADILEYSLPIIENHCPGMPVVFHTADLHFLRLEREANLTKDWAIEKKAEEYRRLEPWLMEQTDLTLVHGSYEKELLVSMGVDSKKIVVVPLILEVPSATPSFDEREGIVFVGGFNHTPNVDAVKYMCNEIMPLLLERGPEIVLSVVGSNITQEILDLEAENVRVLGYVDSVDEVFGSSKISIAPLRFGAGLKRKVAKSLACGTPVVSSAIGVEGMILDPEKEYALANTTEEFVDKIISLYGSSSIWREFSIRGKEQANRLWGFDEATSNLASILNQLGFDLTPPKKRISFH
jgi:glycosyltransferase involved in cell wall biosynthesis